MIFEYSEYLGYDFVSEGVADAKKLTFIKGNKISNLLTFQQKTLLLCFPLYPGYRNLFQGDYVSFGMSAADMQNHYPFTVFVFDDFLPGGLG